MNSGAKPPGKFLVAIIPLPPVVFVVCHISLFVCDCIHLMQLQKSVQEVRKPISENSISAVQK